MHTHMHASRAISPSPTTIVPHVHQFILQVGRCLKQLCFANQLVHALHTLHQQLRVGSPVRLQYLHPAALLRIELVCSESCTHNVCLCEDLYVNTGGPSQKKKPCALIT